MRKRILCAALAAALILQPVGLSGHPANASAANNNSSVLTNRPSHKGASTSANPYTGKTYTHADVFDGMNIYNGIDVSKWNTDIDWEKVKADGIDYAFIRIGYRGYGSTAALCADNMFTTHITGALAAGLHVGVYYFTEAINTAEAIEEANYCIENLKEYDITMPVVLDYEYQYDASGNLVSRKKNLSREQATANSRAFCDKIAEAGYTPMVYANSSDLKTLIDGEALSKDYPIWLANYTTKTSYTGTYDFWQYASNGKVNGISGNVDCNFWYTSQDITNINFNGGDLKQAVISTIPSQSYTGSPLKPAPVIKIAGRTLRLNRDYTLTYSNNINPGKATVTATGKGNYTGTITKAFTVKPKQVTLLSTKAGAKKITLKWAGKNGASGYEIYRASTYNSKYKKIKTITKGTKLSYTNTKLSANREYFYKIRSYAKADGKVLYSAYTKFSAGTTPGGKAAMTRYKLKLLKKPSAKSAKLATIPANATIVYVGRTYLKNKKKFYHVQYQKGSKTYDGYLTSAYGLKYYKSKTTSVKTELRTKAKKSGKVLVTIPKNRTFAVLGTKKSGKTTWYKTSYLKGRKLYTGYVSGKYLK